MSREVLVRQLGALELSLEALLSCLESDPLPAGEVMDSAWVGVERAFLDVRRMLSGDENVRVEETAAIERCQRLYAVAMNVLGRRREEVAAERAMCSEVRSRLRRARSEGASGGACDVRA